MSNLCNISRMSINGRATVYRTEWAQACKEEFETRWLDTSMDNVAAWQPLDLHGALVGAQRLDEVVVRQATGRACRKRGAVTIDNTGIFPAALRLEAEAKLASKALNLLLAVMSEARPREQSRRRTPGPSSPKTQSARLVTTPCHPVFGRLQTSGAIGRGPTSSY